MPFESPNHTQAPNDLFDSILKLIGEAELKVTLAVIRGTLGYHRNGFTCSIVKMAEMTGLSENGVIAGASAAEGRGTIERVIDGKKSTEWRVLFSTSASEVRNKRVKNPTSASEVFLPQPVRQSTSASEGQSRVKESIKKEEKEPVADKPRREPTESQRELARLETLFCELTGRALPARKTAKECKAAAEMWWQPLGRIIQQANGASDKLLREAVEKMRKDNLTIYSPKSVEKVALALYGEQAHLYKARIQQDEEPDPMQGLNDYLRDKEKNNGTR